MDDFERWYLWQLENKEQPISDKDIALAFYNDRYFCDCEGCRYRKEHGMIPLKIRPDCKLPVETSHVRD